MKKVVISQPMFFPWVGLFEQIRLADVFVHYDDVQLPQGRSFMNRVQIKTPTGIKWLSVPIKKGARLINEAVLDDSQNWRDKHLKTLYHNYAKAPFVRDMLEIVQTVYELKTNRLSELNCFAIEMIANYFGLQPSFLRSSDYRIEGVSTERLLNLMLHLNGTVYITGHGARNYFDHNLFEQHGIHIEYMDYQKILYKQLYGSFTPYVSILDLIANQAKDGCNVIISNTVDWKDFIK